MKAAVLEAAGLDNLKLVERPDPVPGPGQVLVRIRAAALNYRDLLTVQGGYGSRQKQADLIPLSDGAGEVVALGEGVSRYKPGDRVLGSFFPNWRDGPPSAAKLSGALGGEADGVMSELRAFAEDAVLPTPAHLSDAEAATLPCAGLTAWSALATQGAVGPGDVVLTQGTGGVSIFALQLARLAGALEQSIKSVRVGGTVSLIGVLSGPNHSFRLPLVVTQNIRLQGVTVGSTAGLAALLRAVAQHRLKPLVDRVFPLDDYRAAIEHMSAGRHFGKVCLEL